MQENNNIEWIDEYLDGSLSDGELQRFEEKLASDIEFEREVHAQRMVRDSIKRAELKEFFNKINEEAKGEWPVKSLFGHFGYRWAIAASIALLVGVSLFIIARRSLDESPDPEFIAQSFVLEVLSEDGLRNLSDQVEVQLIEHKDFQFHYTFSNEVLKLYLKNVDHAPGIKIFYDAFEGYEVEIAGKRYGIEEQGDSTPVPLEIKAGNLD